MTAKLRVQYLFIPIFLFGVVYLQLSYDTQKIKTPTRSFSIPPLLARSLDLGLHSAFASFLWLDTRTEVPMIRNGFEKFYQDFNLITSLDAKFSTPYAYSVLVLPSAIRFKDRNDAAIAIGERGIRDADPDWRIPFYLAVIYHIEKKDRGNAAKYFDTAGHTPGAPFEIRRFSLNYTLSPNVREQTKQIWIAIYQSTKDEATKERAKNYIIRIEMFDYLEAAAKVYKQKYGFFPETPNDLVAKKIIAEVPPDPFGFQFVFNDRGMVNVKQ